MEKSDCCANLPLVFESNEKIVNDIIPKAGTFIFTVMLIKNSKKFTQVPNSFSDLCILKLFNLVYESFLQDLIWALNQPQVIYDYDYKVKSKCCNSMQTLML